MSELVDNHPLSRDVPEYKETIHTLKLKNAYFSRIMSEYETLDKLIVRIEQNVERAEDLALDELKMQRVKMKDYLVDMLRTAV